jgi:hypothetical protein
LLTFLKKQTVLNIIAVFFFIVAIIFSVIFFAVSKNPLLAYKAYSTANLMYELAIASAIISVAKSFSENKKD